VLFFFAQWKLHYWWLATWLDLTWGLHCFHTGNSSLQLTGDFMTRTWSKYSLELDCFDIMVSFDLSPLFGGIGACTLRVQWTSTNSVRRLRSLTGESPGVGLPTLNFLIYSNQPRETCRSYLDLQPKVKSSQVTNHQ
jgi:hypothetical protein